MLDDDVRAEVARRARAAGLDEAVYLNTLLRRHLRLSHHAESEIPSLEVQRDAFLQALLERDAPRAREVVQAALAGGVAVADLYDEVIGPSLHEIGHRWAIDDLTVAQEHYATSVTQGLITTLAAEAPDTDASGRLAVVSTTPDELHQLGALMASDLLGREGWEVINLGAATPADDLARLVDDERPDLVALSASTAGRLPGLSDALTALAGLRPKPVIAVGGALFTGNAAGVARELGADLVLTGMRDLVAAVRERFPPLPA